ncbi:unnamed protein product [Dovyalis caffra]|uniref:Uncharacterized protein n=1 Tax=Dovyalis caffra TaxID=77055 RepID=A0AAV1SGV7_9ROSI|nr:unnamed protein product [Dovyalis caffra]
MVGASVDKETTCSETALKHEEKRKDEKGLLDHVCGAKLGRRSIGRLGVHPPKHRARARFEPARTPWASSPGSWYSLRSHNTDRSTHDQFEKIPMDDYVRDVKISTVEIRSDHFGGGVESRAEIVYPDGEEAAAADEEEEADDQVVVEDKNIVNAVVVSDESKNEVIDDFVISKPTRIKRSDSLDNNLLLLDYPEEKPLVSSRFGHRKVVKASPEGGRALRVAKPKRHETLENTWKTITEGRAIPLTRHVKKSETFKDTWENQGSQLGTSQVDPHAVKKSQTFKDRTNYQMPPVNSSSPGKLRKEPSLSQDDLNRRVEAFIKKFNEEMRLQRQESLNQYKEMISRGGH